MRNLEELNGKHSGRTAFIIGAGTSILQHDLSILDNNISIAINSGYCAYLKANYFLTDDWSVGNWSYFFDDLVKSKTTPLLYKEKLFKQHNLFGDRVIWFNHRKGYNLTKPYLNNKRSNFIWESRTSMGSAIHVAYIMGCSKIILLGNDCYRRNGCRYFWQCPEWKGKRPYRNDNVPVDRYSKCVFKGIETDKDLNLIKLYWNKISIHIPELNLYNASEMSLIDCIPKIGDLNG